MKNSGYNHNFLISYQMMSFICFSGLQKYLNQLGFHIVGYGCTTCIGNSGDLDESVSSAISENGKSVLSVDQEHINSSVSEWFQFKFGSRLRIFSDIVAAAVLSGNRNFEGRVHPLTRANYLASPPLVVAYALAGTVCRQWAIEFLIITPYINASQLQIWRWACGYWSKL